MSVTRRWFVAGLTLAAGGAYSSEGWAEAWARGGETKKIEKAVPAVAAGEHMLWFDKPAENWGEGLPIGNGRIGGMVVAGVGMQRILLNEETFWTGEPKDFRPQDGAIYMESLHNLLVEDGGPQADQVVDERLLSKVGQSYQPLGFVTVEDHAQHGATSFRRSLDLRDGVHTAQASSQSIQMDTFVSAPDGVMVMELRQGAASALHCAVRLGSLQHGSQRVVDGVLLLEVRAPYSAVAANVENANGAVTWDDGGKDRGMRATVALCVLEQSGGRHSLSSDGLMVEGAAAATLLVAVRTSYAGPDKSPSREGLDATALALGDLQQARAQKTGEALRARHVADHRTLFDRVGLRFESGEPVPALDTPALDMPTDARMFAFVGGAADPALAALYFQYGRYLLMASSRPGTWPATTQGIWNHRLRPPQKAGWALDSDLGASYWLAEAGGLPECHAPVFGLAHRLEGSGTHAAKRVYGVKGWTAHTSADIWCSALPEAGASAAAIWKCGAAWLCLQAWDAYQFSGDAAFLRAQYPRMQQASVFFLEHMRADREGWLAAYPESSTWGPYGMPGGAVAFSSFSPAMSNAIVGELLRSTAAAAEVLGVDAWLRPRLLATAAQIRPVTVDPHTGELLEWPDAAWIPEALGSGQLPQIWGLMPGTLVSPEATPALATAAHTTIVGRAPWNADPGSGVAGACACAMARLRDGATAYGILQAHMSGGLLPNLLASMGACPQENGFAIAGNQSFAAAIAEMLLQSHTGEIAFLPALPAEWSGGSYSGLRARGGWTVSLNWHGGRARNAVMTASCDTTAVLRAPDGQGIASVGNARELERLDKARVRLKARKGETYAVTFS